MILQPDERTVFASMATAAFVLGTILGPTLHVVDHQDDHTHGAVLRGADEPDHIHRSGPHAHHDGDSVPEHGDGSVSHFHAVYVAAAPVVEPEARWRDVPAPAPLAPGSGSPPNARVAARGPPDVSL